MTALPISSSFPLREGGAPPTGQGGVPGGGPAPGTAGPPLRPPPAAPVPAGSMHRDRATGRLLVNGVAVCDGCGRPSDTPFCAGARGHVCRVKRATEMRRIRERVVPLWSPGQRPIRAVLPQLDGGMARKGWP